MEEPDDGEADQLPIWGIVGPLNVILQLKSLGSGERWIATELGCSRTTAEHIG